MLVRFILSFKMHWAGFLDYLLALVMSGVVDYDSHALVAWGPSLREATGVPGPLVLVFSCVGLSSSVFILG